MPDDSGFDLDGLLPVLQRLFEFDEEATMQLVQVLGSELAQTIEQLARTSAENRALRHYAGQIADYERQIAVQVDRIWSGSDRDGPTGLDAEWLERMGSLVEMLDGFSHETLESSPGRG